MLEAHNNLFVMLKISFNWQIYDIYTYFNNYAFCFAKLDILSDHLMVH